MKKYSFLLPMFFLAATALHAQGFCYGFKGGVNSSTVGGNDATITPPVPGFPLRIPPESQTNFSGGIMTQWSFLDLLALRAEILYSARAVRYSQNIVNPFSTVPGLPGSIKFSLDVNAHYIEIPVALELMPPLPLPLRPSFYAGASIGILVNHDQSLTTEPSFPIPPPEFHLKKIDPSILLGAGLRYDFPTMISLGLDVRYTMGMQSAVDSISVSGSTFIDQPDIRNRTLSVMGCILFRI